MEDEFGWLKYHGGFHNYGVVFGHYRFCMVSQDGYYESGCIEVCGR